MIHTDRARARMHKHTERARTHPQTLTQNTHNTRTLRRLWHQLKRPLRNEKGGLVWVEVEEANRACQYLPHLLALPKRYCCTPPSVPHSLLPCLPSPPSPALSLCITLTPSVPTIIMCGGRESVRVAETKVFTCANVYTPTSCALVLLVLWLSVWALCLCVCVCVC